ncbi:MAG: HAD hydrolase-like protein [Deinococcales bacterium]
MFALWAICQKLPTFPDSAEALSYLKQHYKLVILSNVDNESFAASNEKLGVDFDAIYTAQDIGSYKPSQGNFDYMLWHLRELGYGKEDILHTAESMFHDHQPANKSGLASCWIYRRHAQEGFGATMHRVKCPSIIFVLIAWQIWSKPTSKIYSCRKLGV